MTYPDPWRAPATYPPELYVADVPEAAARLRRSDAPADLDTLGGFAHYLATGATTDGRYGLYRWDMGPQPGGPAPHFHRTMSEAFFVLSGTVRLHDGRDWSDAGPGDFCHVPEGSVHAFRNESGEPASMLILFTPGAPREAYFEGLVEMFTSGREVSQEEYVAFCTRHDNHLV
ncbi:cupin domain-containing protein [Nocardioides deserti]|uniref:Cupin domain-containing protein n=1 Tax=Nocardioides deserti TaxID=1588644 RepID=A0ABR6U4J0_9ACTN|nr:cupin domain-containing protein [Nocardioides deserti]MBC2959356.1 cupin domain-containing protein [Nocardioides deserti]GGO73255.1 cupin [Nocardioides deserti]